MAVAAPSEPLPSQTEPAETRDGKDLHEAVRLASESKLPLELGSIEISEDGRVVPSAPGHTLTFSFFYKGLPFAGEVGPESGDSVRLVGEFGKMPFTAELPKGRHAIRQVIADSQRSQRTRFFVTREQDLRLAMEAVPPQPRTPVSIVAAVTALIVEALPGIEAMTDTLNERLSAGRKNETSVA
ncbi:hypothetical protein [Algihabitans albus]|uniref:hypothetical protein n=1 Tax=Algihabitans albus TaxID=2164067 RepID=UPI000E5CB4FA|nr:hypothetical protein [Algihabitans albus]